MLNDARGWAKGTLPTYQDRKAFFEAIVNGDPDPIALLRAGDEAAVLRPDRCRAADAHARVMLGAVLHPTLAGGIRARSSARDRSAARSGAAGPRQPGPDRRRAAGHRELVRDCVAVSGHRDLDRR